MDTETESGCNDHAVKDRVRIRQGSTSKDRDRIRQGSTSKRALLQGWDERVARDGAGWGLAGGVLLSSPMATPSSVFSGCFICLQIDVLSLI